MPSEYAKQFRVRYPEIEVELVGHDGNAFAVMGTVSKALKQSGVSKDEVDLFIDEATAGDYSQVLQTVVKWVNVT